MAEDSKFEGRLWAIVSTGQKQYIGRVVDPANYEADSTRWSQLGISPDECPSHLELSPCYELLSVTQMVRFPDGSSSPAREVLVLPVDKCQHPVTRRFRPVEVTWAEDIHELDRVGYVRLILDLQQQILEAREKALGIESSPIQLTNKPLKDFHLVRP